MVWNIRITEEVKKDYAKIEGSIQKQVLADIVKVSQAPLPSPHGYRKPLGNKNGNFFIFSKKDMLFTYLSINKILSGAIIIIKALQFLIFTYSAG